MMINELKISYKNNHLSDFITYMFLKIWNPLKNDYDMNLWKYEPLQVI
jgi:hypothetical protein